MQGFPKPDWVIYGLQWDECEFDCVVGRESAGRARVLAQQGLLRWRAAGQDHSQEVILPVAALENGTASAIASAIQKKHEVGISSMLSTARLSCLQLNCDSVVVNKLVVKWFANVSDVPRTSLILFNVCLQHQVALCLGVMTVYLGFVGRLFGLCAMLRNGEHIRKLEAAVERHLRAHLEIVPEHPLPENLERVDALLHLTHRSLASRRYDAARRRRKESLDEADVAARDEERLASAAGAGGVRRREGEDGGGGRGGRASRRRRRRRRRRRSKRGKGGSTTVRNVSQGEEEEELP